MELVQKLSKLFIRLLDKRLEYMIPKDLCEVLADDRQMCSSDSTKECDGGTKPVIGNWDMFNTPIQEVDGADDRMIGGSKYRAMNLEPWEAMERSATKEEFVAYLRLAAIKHLLREGQKDHTTFIEDMEKAEHILQKLIEVYKS